MKFSMRNRLTSLFVIALAAVAMPALADSTMSNDTSNAANRASDAANNASNAANQASDAANSASNSAANAANQTKGNAAGMTGGDKTAMDTALGKGACSNDVQQFCSAITPGQGRVASCLHSHNDAISSTCQTQLKTAANEFRTMHKACKADVAKYCKGTEAGSGGIISCLKQHEDELSSACHTDTMNFEATG